jgi:MoaA/NifB/PqqE/SkfB family radical SAM enzyme
MGVVAGAPRPWWYAGEFRLAQDGDSIRVRDGDATFTLQGSVASALLSGGLDGPHVRAMARLDARLARFLDALRRDGLRPLTRADVLRGDQYSMLFVELTSRCNERCVHCYADAGPDRHEQLDEATLRTVISDAASLGFGAIQLTGGDPLISPHVVMAARHAKAQGIPVVEIYTNGLALTRALLEPLAAEGVRFAFSVYSHDPAVHDAITQVAGSHARTLEAIRSCVERGLVVRTGSTLFEPNRDHEPELRWMLEQLGVPRQAIAMSHIHAVGRGHYAGGDAALEHEGAHGPAMRGGGKACVSADGRVFPCIFARDLELGSVYDRSLREILADATQIEASADVGPAMAQAAERLSCGECRLRDALLRPKLVRVPLVKLRTPR